mgnify:CR=1 FL=1
MTQYRFVTRSRTGKWYPSLADAQRQANRIGAGFTDALGQFIELEFDLPYWYVYLSFPVGFGILGIFAIELALKDWLSLRRDSGTCADPILEQRQ